MLEDHYISDTITFSFFPVKGGWMTITKITDLDHKSSSTIFIPDPDHQNPPKPGKEKPLLLEDSGPGEITSIHDINEEETSEADQLSVSYDRYGILRFSEQPFAMFTFKPGEEILYRPWWGEPMPTFTDEPEKRVRRLKG